MNRAMRQTAALLAGVRPWLGGAATERALKQAVASGGLETRTDVGVVGLGDASQSGKVGGASPGGLGRDARSRQAPCLGGRAGHDSETVGGGHCNFNFKPKPKDHQ
jgi:hypothetical protein